MKIIIAEKTNKEIKKWQTEQKEAVKIITWTSDLDYRVEINEINLYEFARSHHVGMKLMDLPWIKFQILNYRSISGNHQLEFKDFSDKISVKAYFAERSHIIIKTDNQDINAQNIFVAHHSNHQVVQRVDYDSMGHPSTSQFIGAHKKIEVYWQHKVDKLVNIGMSLTEDNDERFYNTYWEWHFEEFKNIINGFEGISEIISYESPTLNTTIPNRRVVQGELCKENTWRSFHKKGDHTKWIIQFESQNFWKPRTDVARVAKHLGYRLVTFDMPYIDEGHWIEEQLLKHFSHIQAGDLVVWQYPKYSPTLELKMLNWFHERDIIVVSFVHDVTLVREKIGVRNHYNPQDDMKVLSLFDANIMPTNFVKPLMRIANVTLKNIVSLAPYDFITNRPVVPAKYSHDIFYAGSLSKFSNLDNINFPLTVFGEKNFSNIKIINRNIRDGGFVPAEKLSQQLDNGYGLIWDEDVDNDYRQEYTKWNWPYKFSLYMASGLPVIAWRDSAIAEVVTLGNLGIVVDSLADISEAVSAVDESEFVEMAENATIFGNKLVKGESTKAALRALEDKLHILDN